MSCGHGRPVVGQRLEDESGINSRRHNGRRREAGDHAIPAGHDRSDDGKFPEGTIFRLVEDRLAAFSLEIEARPSVVGSTMQHVPPARTDFPVPPGIPPSPLPEPPVSV